MKIDTEIYVDIVDIDNAVDYDISDGSRIVLKTLHTYPLLL